MEHEKAEGAPKARKPLATWKKIHPFNLTHVHKKEDDKKWILCTKCHDHAIGKVGIFNLSHLDSKHQENYRPTPPERNLTMTHESIDHVLTGPPLTMVLETTDEIDLRSPLLEFDVDQCQTHQ
jgi:hypothetical protein